MRRYNLETNGQTRRAFTLLELMLVVFILSILAYSAVSLTENVGNRQDQFRYEQSINQGSRFREAIVYSQPQDSIIRGFVVDMGRLPSSLSELVFGVRKDGDGVTYLTTSQLHTPIFDPSPNPLELSNDDSGDEISLPLLSIRKGYRGTSISGQQHQFGSYLNVTPANSSDFKGTNKPRFGDGWKNISGSGFYILDNSAASISASSELQPDDLTHGWIWEATSGAFGLESIKISSAGKDGKISSATSDHYQNDFAVAQIHIYDWSIGMDELHVRFKNDIFENDIEGRFRARLLVFDAFANRWFQFVSGEITTITRSGSNPVPFVNRGGIPVVQATRRIPAGTHVLLLESINTDNTVLPYTPLVSITALETDNSIQRIETNALIDIEKFTITLRVIDDISGDETVFTSINTDSLILAIQDLNSQLVESINISGSIEFDGSIFSGIASWNSTTDSKIKKLELKYLPASSIRASAAQIVPGTNNILVLNMSSLLN
jgi:prepilin-type N-terminal cleavage/methylation domain-containing protein